MPHVIPAKFLAALAFSAAILAAAPARADTVVYDSIPASLPPNLPSLGYQATSTSEFGDYVQLAPGSERYLTTATVTLSNWALQSVYDPGGTSLGFNVPLTLTLYNPVGGGTTPSVGSVIATTTVDAFIPWRPEADAACSGGGYMSGGTCYNGRAVNITFTVDTGVPDSFIFGLAFDTQSYGANPTGVSGPYNSLNFALATTLPTTGTDADPNSIYWNTSYPGFVTSAVPGSFTPDTNWAPYTPAVQFQAVPEPASLVLLSAGLGMLGLVRRRA